MVVDQLTAETSRSTRGRNQTLESVVSAQDQPGGEMRMPLICCTILANGDLVIGCRRIVCPCFRGENSFCDSLLSARSDVGGLIIMGLTSKSCKLTISSREGRAAISSWRFLSSSVRTFSTRTTVFGSTGPRLHAHGRCAKYCVQMDAHCFSLGRCVVIASGG